MTHETQLQVPRTAHDRFSERRERLKNSSPSAVEQFFYEVDYQTQPGNVADATCYPPKVGKERAERFDKLTSFLAQRVVERALSYENQKNRQQNASAQLSKFDDRVAVANASQVVIDTALRYFGDGQPRTVKYEALTQALEQYSNGSVRDYRRGEYSDYEPNSGYHFCWAELAFLAIELEVDPEFWRTFLPVCVYCQEIYVGAYPPSLARRTERGIATKFRPVDYGGGLTDTEISTIREHYKDLDESALALAAARNAHFAYYGGIRPPPNVA